MKIDLTEKNILVTGASRGIGRAVARQMAEAGARVAVHYRSSQGEAEALAREAGGSAQAFQADFRKTDDCARLFDDVTSAFGGVDVLVNNAGIARHMPLDDGQAQWADDWNAMMAVNLRAPELLCRKAIGHFQENGGGRILNVASRAAFRGDTEDYMAYAASKGGLVALTRSIARAFGGDDVQAFVLAPGFTRTDMAQEFIDSYGEDYATNDLALNRLTEPSDIAPLAVLFASGLADHATGATVDVNAGSYVH
jgi:NAD(P)-dependent dehydrogenase (short-subunit alcohol dehydrogenase family)